MHDIQKQLPKELMDSSSLDAFSWTASNVLIWIPEFNSSFDRTANFMILQLK